MDPSIKGKNTTKVYINDTDTEEQRKSKLEFAEQMKEKGYEVAIVAFEKQEPVSVQSLTKEHKSLLEDVITSVDIIKEKFQNLLNQAGEEKKTKSNDSPESLNGDEAEEEDPLYKELEKIIDKL